MKEKVIEKSEALYSGGRREDHIVRRVPGFAPSSFCYE
jgi:hypothetical protein